MTKLPIVVATGNPHKVEEMRKQLGQWFELSPLPKNYISPVEDGGSFAANALIKAQTAAQRLGTLCVADDSGLCVDALDGAPGIYSSRYAGIEGDDAANNAKLLLALADVPHDQRGAHFVCALSIAAPSGELLALQGRFDGSIGYEAVGEDGFGYDPLFVLPSGRTSAELLPEVKQRISHRGQALARLEKAITEGDLLDRCRAAAGDALRG